MSLAGSIALVTGAGSGIGLATAHRLAREKATVVAAVFNEEQLETAAPFDGIVCDVRSEKSWDRVCSHIEDAYGGLDILVNNAGIHRRATAEETTRDLWNAVMETNAWGTLLGCRKCIPLMRRRGGGSIVNLSSVNALTGVPGMLAYNTSKGAIRTMTMSLALELATDKIRVNCVCPGSVRTPIVDEILDDAADRNAAEAAMRARHPIGYIARPDEIAAVIAFLASDDASFMTGATVPVDGGRSIKG